MRKYFVCLMATVSLFFSCNTVLWAQENALQDFLNAQIASGAKNIKIPKGTYRVEPIKKSHLFLHDLNDVVIDATGVTMLCAETKLAVNLVDCKNLTIKGLTIDYDPLCFTQGRITKISSDKKYLEFEVDEGYPINKLSTRLEIFKPDTKTLRRPSYYGWTPWEKVGERSYRTSKGEKYKYNPALDTEEVGDVLVTNNSFTPSGKVPHTILSERCQFLRMEDVTLYSGSCFGFFEVNCTKSTYLRCTVDRCPVEKDYIKRTARLRSTNADAFHSKHPCIGPQLLNCRARFQGDDGLNISTQCDLVLSGRGNEVRILASRTSLFEVGDTLETLTFEGQRLPWIKILSVCSDGGTTESERMQIEKLKLDKNLKQRMLSRKAEVLKLVVDHEVNIGFGAVVSNPHKQGNYFLIENCDFSYNRSRGVLVKGSHGIIRNNTFIANWMSAISIAPETWWMLGGCSDDILIQGNTIRNNEKAHAIDVSGKGFSKQIPSVGLHRDIQIVQNIIQNSPQPVVHLQGVEDSSIRENVWQGTFEESVKLDHCEEVVIK